MQFTLLNLLSAVAIGLVIFGMAKVPSLKAKALLYVLPIPISIGLIATHGVVSASNLIGLMLIWVFMVTTRFLHDKLRVAIIPSDVIAAVLYIVLGYFAITILVIPFWVALSIFVVLWSGIVLVFHQTVTPERSFSPSALPPATKGLIATAVSYAIYSVQHLLAGIVVTFPYNGIFAVIETQHHLKHFIRAVVRNTAAIAALFTSMYYLQDVLSLALNLAVGWIAFAIVLAGVQKISV